MTVGRDPDGPVCGCGCCAAVAAELAALRQELGQLAGLVIVAGIGADPARAGDDFDDEF